MNMYKSVILVAITALSSFSCEVEKTEANKPNILIVFPDQYRRYSAGFWSQARYTEKTIGRPDPVHTPAIDKLANNGVVFTNAISNYPLCSPHRGMLLSGMYPEQNGIWNNCRKDRPDALNKDVTAITDVFFNAGYNVSYFGKCHWIKTAPLFDTNGNYVGTTDEPGGNFINGYDTYVPPGADRHSIEYFYQSIVDNHVNPMAFSSDPETVGGNKDGQPFRPKEFSPKTESRHIVDYIKNDRNQRDANKPFFMIWAPNPPHAPWDMKNTDMDEYEKHYSEERVPDINDLLSRDNADSSAARHVRNYFANVTSVDKYIGLVIEELEASGLLENTIVVFTSDHGEMLGSHHKSGKNVIETESIAIPLIIHWPNMLKPSIEEGFFNVPDLMPTLLGLAGLDGLIPNDVEGIDFSEKLLTGSVNGKIGMNSSLLLLPKAKGMVNAQFTLGVNDLGDGKCEVFLYDNVNDPYQLVKLNAGERKEIASRLLIELGQLLAKTNDPWYKDRKFNDQIKYPKF